MSKSKEKKLKTTKAKAKAKRERYKERKNYVSVFKETAYRATLQRGFRASKGAD